MRDTWVGLGSLDQDRYLPLEQVRQSQEMLLHECAIVHSNDKKMNSLLGSDLMINYVCQQLKEQRRFLDASLQGPLSLKELPDVQRTVYTLQILHRDSKL